MSALSKQYFHSPLLLLLALVLSQSACQSSRAPRAQLSEAAAAQYKAAAEAEGLKAPSEEESTLAIEVTAAELSLAVPAPTSTQRPQRSFELSLEDYHAFFEQPPAQILGHFKLEPVRDGTELLGFRILSLDAPWTETVDLQADDIIVGIDGRLPRTPQAYHEKWEQLKRQAQIIRVQVQRRLERFELVWTPLER